MTVALAPDVLDALRLIELVDTAAYRLVCAEAARDAAGDDFTDDTTLELVEEAAYADGWLMALGEALGLLLGRDPLPLVVEAKGKAEQARSVMVTGMEKLITGVGR